MYVGETKPSQQVIVIDGKESGPYAGVSPDTQVFSPDSRHFAYGTVRGGRSFVVVDGEEPAKRSSLTMALCTLETF